MTVVPLKHLVRINERSLPETTDPDFEFRYIEIGRVGRGVLLDEPERLIFADAPSRARRLVRGGDTIISTVRTYLRAVWPVPETRSGLVVSTGFAVFTPGPQLDPRYLGWLAQSDPVVESIVARSDGVSYPAINALDIGDLYVQVVSIDTQRAIADVLDSETSHIDALIAKKRHLQDVLHQRMWAVLASEILTTEPPVVPLRRALSAITDGPFGSAFSSCEYTDYGLAVVRLGNIGFAEWRNDEVAYLPLRRLEEFRRCEVREGNLLIAGLGDAVNHAGRACVAPDLGQAIVKGKCFCAQVDPSRAIPYFLALFCSSPSGAEAVAVGARGSTRSMINLDIVKAMPVPVPALEVQRRIVEKIQRVRAQSTTVRQDLDKQIALLQERRQALITAAVTGELDIPGAA